MWLVIFVQILKPGNIFSNRIRKLAWIHHIIIQIISLQWFIFHRRDIYTDWLIKNIWRKAPSNSMLHLSYCILRHSWLLRDQLWFECAFSIDTLWINMLLSHQSMFSIIIQHGMLINLNLWLGVLELHTLIHFSNVQLGWLRFSVVWFYQTQFIQFVWDFLVGAEKAHIHLLVLLASWCWGWRFVLRNVVVVVSCWHVVHLIKSMICYLIHHLFSLLLHNTFTLPIYLWLIIKHTLFIRLHQILRCLLSIFQFSSKVYQSLLCLI